MAETTRASSSELAPSHHRALRAAAICGALAVVVGVVGHGVGDVTGEGVNPGSSSQALTDAYALYLQRFQVGAGLSLVAFVLQLTFLGALWARVRVGSEPLAVVAVLGGAASAATWWLLTAGLDTAKSTAATYNDVSAARLLLLVSWETARLATAPNLVMIGACAVAGWRCRSLPRWLTLVSCVFFTVSLIGMLPAGPAGGAALMGGLWLLVISIYLTVARPLCVAGHPSGTAAPAGRHS